MIRLFVIILMAIVAVTVLRMVAGVLARGLGGVFDSGGNPAARRAGQASQGGELQRDPVCGTFVSPASSVTLKSGGKVVHFCSAACRDKYRG